MRRPLSALLAAALVVGWAPAALAQGDALRLSANEIPQSCAAICQPIVQLVSACNVQQTGPASSTSGTTGTPPSPPQPAGAGPAPAADRAGKKSKSNGEPSVAASPPNGPAGAGAGQPAAAPSTPGQNGIGDPPAPAPAPAPALEGGPGGKSHGKAKKARGVARQLRRDAQAQCVCPNRSFDVPAVMANCASCVNQQGSSNANLNAMMNRCAFPSTTFTPQATSLVAGVNVQATPVAATGPSPPGAASGPAPAAGGPPAPAAGGPASGGPAGGPAGPAGGPPAPSGGPPAAGAGPPAPAAGPGGLGTGPDPLGPLGGTTTASPSLASLLGSASPARLVENGVISTALAASSFALLLVAWP